MIPEYVQLNEDTRRVIRRHLRVGTSSGVWWCPFCDNSQVEGHSVCGKCGAMVVTKPIAPIVETTLPVREGMEGIRQAEAAGQIGPAPAAPGAAAELESVPVRNLTPRTKRTPPPKATPRGGGR